MYPPGAHKLDFTIVEPQSEVTLYDFEFRLKIYYTNPMLTSQQ